MLSSAWQEKDLPEICVVLLMFVPRAVITRAEGHVSFSPPGHQSLEELVARLGLESVLHGSCLQQKQNPSRSLLGAGVSQGIAAMAEAGRVLRCAARAGCSVSTWHLPSSPAPWLKFGPCPTCLGSSPFQVYCRCPAPDSAFCKCTSALHRQVSLCLPGSPFSAQLPNRLTRHSDLFLNFCCCCCYVSVLTWQL